MPNRGYVIGCPFYESESQLQINCEDSPHRFKTLKDKKLWMEKHCIADNGYQTCKFAKGLEEVYAGENPKEKIKDYQICQMSAELKKMNSLATKLQNRINTLTKELKPLKTKFEALERVAEKQRGLLKQSASKEKAVTKEIMALARIYEDRFAYLLVHSMIRELDINAVDEWLKTHEYRIVPAEDDGKRVTKYRIEVRDSELYENRGPSAEDSGTDKEEEPKKRG